MELLRNMICVTRNTSMRSEGIPAGVSGETGKKKHVFCASSCIKFGSFSDVVSAATDFTIFVLAGNPSKRQNERFQIVTIKLVFHLLTILCQAAEVEAIGGIVPVRSLPNLQSEPAKVVTSKSSSAPFDIHLAR